MKFVADFHIHSKYSRATSPLMDLEHLSETAKKKGIKVLGTGDFTHPAWFAELKEKLAPKEPGLFMLKSSPENGTRFILSSEISCIYSKGGRVRKIHIVVLSPDFQTVEQINQKLSFVGNLAADGRPILGLDAKELVKIILDINPSCFIIPSHVWTPWFSVFGSKSGFNSLEECFEDYTKYIYSVETGLSSDPPMNWRLSALDKITLVSNSDSHSPQKIGREANVFDAELDYFSIIEAIKEKNPQKFLYTVEFFPQEGKYHYDGHRNCNIRLSPKETEKYKGICPVCGKPLTVGVLSRVEELADREEGFRPENAIPYKSLIPLEEIIAEVLGRGVGTKEVAKEYENLIEKFGSEYNVLLQSNISDLKNATLPEIAEGILRVREGRVEVEPGYDGVYGKIRIFSSQEEKREASSQKTLF
jgi:uncharacterized protein (TIGR00375 family)